MKTITVATTSRRTVASLELPRAVHVSGAFPNNVYRTLEDNEENRAKDYEYMVSHYGKDTLVYQQDADGNTVRDNHFDLDRHELHLCAQGF